MMQKVNAQQTDSSSIKFSGYLEAYYSYDFNKPVNHIGQPFLYNYNRHNEFNINLSYIKASYLSTKLRGNLALMAGTYSNANLSSEPQTLQHIYEANVGVKLSEHQDWWIDAGILPSHIGFESAAGMDCWTLTRSLPAENSPYFETGARMSYATPDGRWYLAVLLLNGWQRTTRVDGNNTPAFGHQLTFKINSKFLLNSSSFIGNDKPDSVRKMRYFHDLYGQYRWNEKLGITAGFDIGVEQKEKNSSKWNSWYSPVLIVRYAPTTKCAIAGRLEKFRDQNNVIVYQPTSNGADLYGYSLNFDYAIRKNALWRVEGRCLHSRRPSLSKEGLLTNNDFFITTSLAIRFD